MIIYAYYIYIYIQAFTITNWLSEKEEILYKFHTEIGFLMAFLALLFNIASL